METSQTELDAAKALVERIMEQFADKKFMEDIQYPRIAQESWGQGTTWEKVANAIHAFVKWKIDLGQAKVLEFDPDGVPGSKEYYWIVKIGELVLNKTGKDNTERNPDWISETVIRKEIWGFYNNSVAKNLLGRKNLHLLAKIAGKEDFYQWKEEFDKGKNELQNLLRSMHFALERLIIYEKLGQYLRQNEEIPHDGSGYGDPDAIDLSDSKSNKMYEICHLLMVYWELTIQNKASIPNDKYKWTISNMIDIYKGSPYVRKRIRQAKTIQYYGYKFSEKLLSKFPTDYKPDPENSNEK